MKSGPIEIQINSQANTKQHSIQLGTMYVWCMCICMCMCVFILCRFSTVNIQSCYLIERYCRFICVWPFGDRIYSIYLAVYLKHIELKWYAAFEMKIIRGNDNILWMIPFSGYSFAVLCVINKWWILQSTCVLPDSWNLMYIVLNVFSDCNTMY